MGVITLTGGRGYQDIGTVGQTVQQLAGNVQSINQILDVGLRNSRDYQNGWIRVSDMIGLGICKLINTDQLQYIPAEGTSLTASDSLVVTAGNLTLVNDSASPSASQYYGTNSGSTLGYYNLPAGATGANPTGAVTFSQVNGSATTFMRSDAAPELSSSIYSSLNVVSTLCYRDSNGNVHANNFESAITGNAAIGTITLTNASARIQTFTSGSGSAIVILPDATTLHVGHTIELDNNASGNLTVQLSGTGTTFLTMAPGSYLVLQCTSISFPAGEWNYWWASYPTANGVITPASIGLSFVESAGWNSSSGAIQISLTVPQDILIPYNCTLREVDILTQGGSGSCTVTIRRSAAIAGAIGTQPPSVDITNGYSPQITTSATPYTNTTFTGWTTTTFTQNDVLRLTLTANTNFTSVKIILRMY